MSSHVDDEIQRRIAHARAEEERKRLERAEFAAARTAGLAKRNARRLYNQRQNRSGTSVKTYRLHNCQDRHTSWLDFARCIWPRAEVDGDGPYAAVDCWARSITLYASLDQAQNRKRSLDHDGCPTDCRGRHRVVALDPGPESGAAA